MAVKGINPLEAHCEKIVLAVAGAALVGVVVWQFAGPRPTVRVGNSEHELTEAYGQLEKRAMLVRSQINGPGSAASLPPEDMPLGLLADAGDFSAATVAPSPKLAIAFGTAGIPVVGDTPLDPSGTRFAEVTLPAPAKPTAAQVTATIHPQELAFHQDLVKYVAEPDRPDMVAVSVETTFPAAAVRDALRHDPDGPEGPIQPIPAVWWNGPITTIMDVELQRQKLMPDGTWGAEEEVARMPGRLELRYEMTEAGMKGMSSDDLRQWAAEAVQFAEEIRRPPFYAIVFGDEWIPPSEVDPLVGVQAVSPEEQRMRRALEGVRRDIAAVERQIEELGGQPSQPGRRPRPDGGGGHDQPTREPERTPDDRDERRRQTLEKRLENLRQEEARIIDELVAMGAKNIPGVEQFEPMMNQPGLTSEAEIEPPLLEADEVRIWAHDVNVERGATYRYRVRVWVTNPFFGHDAGLVDEQKSLATDPLLASEPSEWSDNVDVHDEAYYFITSAQEGGLTAGARAVASVYVFRWGYWRGGTARMEPGDVLVTDVQSPMLGALLAQVDVPNPEGWPRPQPGHPVDPHGPEGPHGPAGVGQPLAGGEEEQPPEVEFEPIPVTRNVVLLDVGPSVNANGEKVAYLREESGSIVDRDPELERRKRTFQLVESSATRGQEALKPKEAPAPQQPSDPRGPRMPDDDRNLIPDNRPGGPGGG